MLVGRGTETSRLLEQRSPGNDHVYLSDRGSPTSLGVLSSWRCPPMVNLTRGAAAVALVEVDLIPLIVVVITLGADLVTPGGSHKRAAAVAAAAAGRRGGP